MVLQNKISSSLTSRDDPIVRYPRMCSKNLSPLSGLDWIAPYGGHRRRLTQHGTRSTRVELNSTAVLGVARRESSISENTTSISINFPYLIQLNATSHLLYLALVGLDPVFPRGQMLSFCHYLAMISSPREMEMTIPFPRSQTQNQVPTSVHRAHVHIWMSWNEVTAHISVSVSQASKHVRQLVSQSVRHSVTSALLPKISNMGPSSARFASSCTLHPRPVARTWPRQNGL